MRRLPGTIERELRALAARVGRDPNLVQGAGGNVSCKDGDCLWIKASGTWMAHAEREDLFLPVGLGAARDRQAAPPPLEDSCNADGVLLRPSIETALHALLPQRVVLHVHSVNALGWMLRSDGRTALAERLAGLPWVWVDYHQPGPALARAVAQSVDAAAQPPLVVALANHGLVLGAEDCEALERLLAEVERRLDCAPRELQPGNETALRLRGGATGWRLPLEPAVHGLATDTVALTVLRQGPLFPDQVVFLGPGLPEASPGDTADVAAGRLGVPGADPSPWVLFPGEGVLVSARFTAGAEALLGCLARVTRRLPDARVSVLPAAEVAALLGWDAERYRRALDPPGPRGAPGEGA